MLFVFFFKQKTAYEMSASLVGSEMCIRDRTTRVSDWNGRKFTLIDTGGIEPRTDSEILTFMREQAEIAISHP